MKAGKWIMALFCMLFSLATLPVFAFADRNAFPFHQRMIRSTANNAEVVSKRLLKDANPSTSSGPKIVDFAYLHWYGLIAVVKGDGSVVTITVDVGEKSEYDCQAVIESWTDIVQIDSCQEAVFGLKSDGTVVGFPDYYDYDDFKEWNNVEKVHAAIWGIAIGLRRDGSVVVAGADDEADWSDWRDLQELAVFTADGSYAIGLRTDGRLLCCDPWSGGSEELYGWVGDNKNVVAVDNSGWLLLGLKADGTVVSGGQAWSEDISKLTGIKQICAVGSTAVGLKADGTVTAKPAYYGIDNAVSQWSDIKELFHNEHDTYDSGSWINELVGLKVDGTLEVFGFDEDTTAVLKQWDNIVRVKILAGYVVGWKADGSVVTAGFSLPE